MLDLLPDELPPRAAAAGGLPARGRAPRARRAAGRLRAAGARPGHRLGDAPRARRATASRWSIPRGQGCCGALAMHAGAAERRPPLARRNLDAFPDDVDAVVTNAAGCGSGMQRVRRCCSRASPSRSAAERFAAPHRRRQRLPRRSSGCASAPPPLRRPLTRRLPRRLPPRPRAARARRAARAADGHRRRDARRSRPSRSCAAARPAPTTSSSPRPPPHSAGARPTTCSPRVRS